MFDSTVSDVVIFIGLFARQGRMSESVVADFAGIGSQAISAKKSECSDVGFMHPLLLMGLRVH